MELKDIMALVHPALAVGVVFPVIGIAVNFAWQTRQRRLQTTEAGGKSKIPPVVGREHLKIGRWLTGLVVGVSLIALAASVTFKGVFKDFSPDKMPEAIFVVLMFVATIASLFFLYKAKPNQPVWRGTFAALTSAGLIILGSQDGVWRLSNQWYISHYYYGITASILMIISLAIIPEIYKDKKWRIAHTVLNCIAIILFFGQAVTGSRDLFQIPGSW
jgi:MFS family permease